MYKLDEKTFRKVPEVTAVFWVAKLITTALGEATSDWLVNAINPYLAVTLGGVGIVIALFLQFRVSRYYPSIYWLTAAMVAIFGTMAADGAHVQLGIPYAVSSVVFAIVLAAVFISWRKSEGTLSIHTVTTRKREIFYWLTVMATFALGTAVGDLTAATFGLGFLGSGFLFIGLILVPAIAFWKFGLNEVAAFWTAYIITRPLGASFADWLSKPSGLHWGDAKVSIICVILLISVVSYMTFDTGEATLEGEVKGYPRKR